jgi:hypothetical protein
MRNTDPVEAAVLAHETADHREGIEILRSRVTLLDGDDRLLVQMYLEHGNTFQQIAQLTGRDATSIARRIRRITRRLADDTYLLCRGTRNRFSSSELGIVRDYLVCGLPQRDICRDRQVTLYRVKATIRKARRHAAVERTRKRGKKHGNV